MNQAINTLCVQPEQWIEPTDFRNFFDHPERPLEIDLGSGKGRFLLARATQFPQINFLGMDRMLLRIKKVSQKAIRKKLHNIRLCRIEAYYAITYLIPSESVDTYYIFYPDPWPKEKHHHNRLFNPPFMEAIARTLKPGGKIHCATDHAPYFQEIHTLFKNNPHFETSETFVPSPEETTDFELIFSHKTPNRCSWTRK